MYLTGETRHRLSSFGKRLILQVEIRYVRTESIGGFIECDDAVTYAWRDATIEHLQELNKPPFSNISTENS